MIKINHNKVTKTAIGVTDAVGADLDRKYRQITTATGKYNSGKVKVVQDNV